MANGWKKTPNSKPTITITMDEDMIKTIDDYQFDNRIRSRSQAIKELIEKGILQLDKKDKE